MHFEYPLKWLQCCLTVKWLVPHETAAILAHVLCTPYSHTPVYSVTLFEATYICSMHVCLIVPCHLHFWQDDQDLLCATAVMWGWNGYRNKSQHRKLTLEKKILLLLLPGQSPFDHESGTISQSMFYFYDCSHQGGIRQDSGTLPLSYPCSPLVIVVVLIRLFFS